MPEKITIDRSSTNTAAIESHNAETKAGIEMSDQIYPAHARIRKSFGEMMRKLSVTSSQ
jgi:hypothetical protein